MSSPLDRIEASVEWAEDNGIYGTTRFLTTDVRALVNVAKAAEEALIAARVVLPTRRSEQTTVVALYAEWQEAVERMDELSSALAALGKAAVCAPGADPVYEGREDFALLERRASKPAEGLLDGFLLELNRFDTETLVAIADYRDAIRPDGWLQRCIREYVETWR